MLWSYALDRTVRGSPDSTTSRKYCRILLGTYAVRILVAAQLIEGGFPPANPNKVYALTPKQITAVDLKRLQALQAPATLRSLGSTVAGSGKHTIEKHFSLESHISGRDTPQHFTHQCTASANDLGLQKWWDLKQLIESPGSRAKGARPAPSYTEKDVWTYKGRRFGGVFELTDKASIDFLDAWEIQLQPDFGFPRAIEMTNSAGSPSLVNSTAFVAGRFDAETSSVEKGMTRVFAII
ncbi:hypothetical protein C7212DRAFT_345418 [Tuber magnatum]|uniref:Uncharacterized protein n=1 Tax=Tuber magnatum TaxID=42249 RepID=A0A317SM30_9PEZI|nr:hypothetical protein C7212DRAFT_345418 [Tuber magnatum]